MPQAAKGWHTPSRGNNSNDTHPGATITQVGEVTITETADVVVMADVVADVDVATRTEHHKKSNATTVVKLGTSHTNAQNQRRCRDLRLL